MNAYFVFHSGAPFSDAASKKLVAKVTQFLTDNDIIVDTYCISSNEDGIKKDMGRHLGITISEPVPFHI